MTIQQMLTVIWARRRLVGYLFFGTLFLGVVGSLAWPKSYVAQTSVVIDSRTTNPISGAIEPSTELLTSVVATQMDVIASPAVALEVVDSLHLAERQPFQKLYSRDAPDNGPIREWIATYLLKKLNVSPGKDSSVVNISVSNHDPRLAADLANAFANSYILVSLGLKTDPARRQSAWFAAQLQGLKQSLQAAQQALSDFQQAHDMVGTNEQLDIENARLTDISNQLVTAQTTMYESQTHLQQLKQAVQRDRLAELPDMVGSALLQGLKADLTRAESNLADIYERYGKNHPHYLSAAAQVEALRGKLSVEITHMKGTIAQSAEIAERQVAQLQESLAQQRTRILQLKNQRDQIDVYKSEVDNAQKAYDDAFHRAGEISLESRLDQSSIAVLSAATVPVRASQPKILWNILIAALLGGMIGVACPLILEVLSPRIRSRSDLVDSLGIVVFGEIPGMISLPGRTMDGTATAGRSWLKLLGVER